ncbi:MAG: hypothetical protein RIS70_4208 [Planctomycetota bacterium]|jgi:hypothetical protein
MAPYVDCYAISSTGWLPQLVAAWSLNTRITWPGLYWNDGVMTFVIYSLVCLFVGIVTVTSLNLLSLPKESSARHVWPLLIVAGVLIQFLPRTADGVQLIPLAPWKYWGDWLAFFLSLLCWLFLFVSASSARSTAWGDQVNMCRCGLIMLGLTALLTPCDPLYGRPSQTTSITSVSRIPVQPQSSFFDMGHHRRQVSQWKTRQEAAQQSLRQLEQDKKRVAEQLQAMGMASENDRIGMKPRRDLAEEVHELDCQMSRVRTECELLQSAIVSSESKLRRIERYQLLEQSGSLGSDESKQLAMLQAELDAQLRENNAGGASAMQFKVDQILKDAMGSNKSGG